MVPIDAGYWMYAVNMADRMMYRCCQLTGSEQVDDVVYLAGDYVINADTGYEFYRREDFHKYWRPVCDWELYAKR